MHVPDTNTSTTNLNTKSSPTATSTSTSGSGRSWMLFGRKAHSCRERSSEASVVGELSSVIKFKFDAH